MKALNFVQNNTHVKYLGILFFFVLFFSNAMGQSNKALPSEKIIKLIPDKISGFYPNEEFKSKVIKLGNIQYSMAEKSFTAKRKRSIKILLFDYKEAPVMYNQVTRNWNMFTVVETDSLIVRPVVVKDCTGWETYNVRKKNSQILLGICNRFFLTIEGRGVELEVLKEVVQKINFEKFPK